MKNKKTACYDTPCRDGAFVVLFCIKQNTLHFLLAQREDDQLWEFLGGGFDLRDYDAKTAMVREAWEEAKIRLKPDKQVVYFAHMTQKLPIQIFGEGQKGHVFYFLKELPVRYLRKKFKTSHDHLDIRWHTLEEILHEGEAVYKSATLRLILRFLRFQEDREFQFGILREKFFFNGYEF